MIIDPAASTRDIRRVQKLLGTMDRGLDKVAARTANKVAQGARTDAVRLIRQDVALSARDIRNAFVIHKATWTHPVAELSGSGRRSAGLDHYPTRPGASAATRPRRGVSVKIKTRLPHKTVRGSFWMPTRGGARLLVKRTGGKRLPVKRLYGPSMMTYYRRESLQRRLRRRIGDRLARVYVQELNNLVRQT
ncbi:hypothetical protein GGQ74_000080 [Desulfobaculum xiamenense]|uniref:Prophage minor tail protein Z (GPZ) n=1 Tax=Desulfobaculum xiamenense TaxID=995050 RepID=A0A846QH42_9BACT|nr:phage tail protein [Desulfobaculum xiamenense]NJB66440.1 hypothetical protein [Desulfobaculum xiamenense]